MSEKLLKNKERYLRDGIPIRLGGMAANLARIYSISKNHLNIKPVETMITESKFFIDWTVKDVDLNTQIFLLELQRELVRWQFNLSVIWNNETKRQEMADKAKEYSDKLLEISGLLKY